MNIPFALDGGLTKRFHTVHTIKENTVATHSYGVVVLVMGLTNGRASRNLILAALSHDMAEHQLGDVPAPAKRALDIYDKFKEYEEETLRGAGWVFSLTDDEERILKIADSLDGLLFCGQEYRSGNSYIYPVMKRFHSYILENVDDHSEAYEQKFVSALLSHYGLDMVLNGPR